MAARLPALSLLVALTAGLSACSGEISVGGGTPAVDQADLETQISDELAQQVGRPPEEIVCPGDLDAEVDATIGCTLNDSGESYPVIITVTSVDEETESVLYDIEVAEEPIS